jgi:hypothetical protein
MATCAWCSLENGPEQPFILAKILHLDTPFRSALDFRLTLCLLISCPTLNPLGISQDPCQIAIRSLRLLLASSTLLAYALRSVVY